MVKILTAHEHASSLLESRLPKAGPPIPREWWHAQRLLPFVLKAACGALCLISLDARAQELELSPTRPTIANSATIQNRGVLQVEVGYDAYPQRVPGNQEAAGASFYYVPLDRLRLDLSLAPYSHQQDDGVVVSGVGTIQAGGKVVLAKEKRGRPAPALGIQYEAEFPTASEEALQGSGQQVILIANHHYGRNGVADIILNGSLVQSDCQTRAGCSYGGQHSLALSYHIRENTRLYTEVFAQNTSQSDTPPGTYVFGGFYQKVRDAFGVDGGVRFGVTDHSASVGVTLGLVLGKRLQRFPSSK